MHCGLRSAAKHGWGRQQQPACISVQCARHVRSSPCHSSPGSGTRPRPVHVCNSSVRTSEGHYHTHQSAKRASAVSSRHACVSSAYAAPVHAARRGRPAQPSHRTFWQCPQPFAPAQCSASSGHGRCSEQAQSLLEAGVRCGQQHQSQLICRDGGEAEIRCAVADIMNTMHTFGKFSREKRGACLRKSSCSQERRRSACVHYESAGISIAGIGSMTPR